MLLTLRGMFFSYFSNTRELNTVAAKPISDYQTAFSLSQLARELANGTPGQCEALARGAVSARYEVR